MLEAYALKLRKYEKWVSYYVAFCFVVFFGSAGYEVYSILVLKEDNPKYFFFKFGGGVFAVTFYLTIVYGAFLNAFHPGLNGVSSSTNSIILKFKQGLWCLLGLVFLYGAITTLFSI